MNLLNHLSWASYFETVMTLLVLYYVFVGVRFYAADIQKLTGHIAKNDARRDLADSLLYQETGNPANNTNVPESYTDDNYPDKDILEADKLTAAVKGCILAASGKAYAPDQLIPQIKDIFNRHPSLKNSPHRPAINELVVSECGRTGVAELTEDEVDAWWSG